MLLLLSWAIAAPWTVENINDNCFAGTISPDGGRVILMLSRWDDLSDHVQYWRPNLPPLWDEPEAGLITGRAEAEQEVDANDGFGFSWRIGDVASIGIIGFHTMLVDMPDAPGVTYRVGVERDQLVAAIATGQSLDLLRRGELIVSVPIEKGAKLSKKLARCAGK